MEDFRFILEKSNSKFLYQNKEDYLEYSLNNFDKVLIDYYLLVWFWKNKANYLIKLNNYSVVLKKIEDGFFNSIYFFESFFFYKRIESNFYSYFFNFLLNLSLDLKFLCLNNLFVDKVLFFNRVLFLEFFIYVTDMDFDVDSISDFITLVDDSKYIFDEVLFDNLVLRFKNESSFEWLYDFTFFNSNFLYTRIKRRKFLIKSLISINNGNIVYNTNSPIVLLLLDFFYKKKLDFCVNFEFFNKSLKEEQEKKNIYNVLVRFNLLPYIRFFLLNKFKSVGFFSIFSLFSNIYFLCTIFFNILKRLFDFNFISISNLNSLIYLVNDLRSPNYVFNVNRIFSMVILVKFKGYNKNIKFFCKELFFCKEVLFFLFNFVFNVTFLKKKYIYVSGISFYYDRLLLKLRNSIDISHVLKGSLSLNIKFDILLKHLSFFIKDSLFLDFLKNNIYIFFFKTKDFELNKDLYILLYDFYYKYLDLNVDCSLSFSRHISAFNDISKRDLSLSFFQDFGDFIYFRFLNNFYIFVKEKTNFIFKLVSFNVLNFLLNVLNTKPLSLRWLDLKLDNLFICGVLLKKNKNCFNVSLPYMFLLNILKDLNVVSYNFMFLKIRYKSSLFSLSIFGIFSYYYNIYFSIYIYYHKIFNGFFFKKFYYVLRKSCFLTINLKLKNLNKSLTLKQFSDNYFFFLNYIRKIRIYNNFINIDIWGVIKHLNLLEISYLMTQTILLHTTRKQDISDEKYLDFISFKYSLKLWNILYNFDLLFKNFLFYNNSLFIVLLKRLDIDGGFVTITPNFFTFEDLFFELNFKLKRFFLDYMDLFLFNEDYIFVNDYVFFWKKQEKFLIDNFLCKSIFIENFEWFFWIINEKISLDIKISRRLGIDIRDLDSFTYHDYKLICEMEEKVGFIDAESWLLDTELNFDEDDIYV